MPMKYLGVLISNNCTILNKKIMKTDSNLNVFCPIETMSIKLILLPWAETEISSTFAFS